MFTGNFFFSFFKIFDVQNAIFFLNFQIHKTVFETKIEKRCNIEFEKVCTNSFKQQPIIETIHICTTTPEKLCNVTLDAPIEAKLATRLASGLEKQCDVHYKTICETKYEEKEVIEEINSEMMTTLKAVPNTNCESESQEICITSECPIVFPKKICEAKERSQVALLPKVSNILPRLLLFTKTNSILML